MNARKRQALRFSRAVLWLAYAIVWLGGVSSHLLVGNTPANMSWAAPVFLILASAIVALAANEDWRALLLTFGLGFAAEAVGVAAGYPFGSYVYTAVLAPSVFGVPPVMAGAWMILIAWVRQVRLPFWAGAVVMVLIDLLIDPLAVHTVKFWRWLTPGPYYGVPLSNFAGWFLVSLVLLWLLRRPPPRNGEVMMIGSSILLFFAMVGLAHGYFALASIGILLCGAGYWRWSSSTVSNRI